MFAAKIVGILVVVVVSHLLCRRWRRRILQEACDWVAGFPKPGAGHCPGDGVVKREIHNDARSNARLVWVLEIVVVLVALWGACAL